MRKQHTLYTLLVALFALVAQLQVAMADSNEGVIRGRITDATTQEAIIGAAVIIEGTTHGAATDINGEFLLTNVSAGDVQVSVTYVGYKPFLSETLSIKGEESTEINVSLVENVSELESVVVVATRKVSNDAGLLNQMRNLSLVASGVSSQSIARTQDRDASEVVRRIPGISIVDDKFVVVRGLAQRYNNVWINGAAVPSSEADSRSFSFDVIPSGQIENVMIIKSPSAEIPADFSGGFVQVRTKVLPEENFIQLSYSTGINTVTQFNDFLYNPGSGTDFLGFDNGKRSLRSAAASKVDNSDNAAVDLASKEGFNSDWRVKEKWALPDQKFNFAISRRIEGNNEDYFGIVGAMNYYNTSKSFINMENSRFDVYDTESDRSNYAYNYTDNQYSQDVKVGAMLNLSYTPKMRSNGNINRYEFRNLFNQLGKNTYTTREGYRDVSGYYEQYQEEYRYTSRTSYTGQFAGDHTRERSRIDWNVAYSYANRNQPDRRVVERQKDESNGITDYSVYTSSISRDFIELDEHLLSGAGNYTLDLSSGENPKQLKAGVYLDYKSRDYQTRDFEYKWNIGADLPDGFTSLPTADIMAYDMMGIDKIHINDVSDVTDNYSATSSQQAAYVALNLPLGLFNINAGARLESMNTEVTSYGASINTVRKYDYLNLLPSLNATYNLNPKSLFRLAYGMSVNRPEFRELSPSTYEDFDLYSLVMGNPDLEQAVIQNVDLRYEWYPQTGEVVSVSAFYKHFNNPIEWTYTDAGGSYIYSFENASSAELYGIEVEVRKNLDFINAPNFTLSANGSLIESMVHFSDESLEHDRAMQGQSPYLVNAGIFYQSQSIGFSAGLLYNRIGKRIVGIGRSTSSTGDTQNNNIPDIYEMPRNGVDLTLSQRLSETFELKLMLRDLIAENVTYAQFPTFTDANGVEQTRKQITKSYNPGTSISLTISAKF